MTSRTEPGLSGVYELLDDISKQLDDATQVETFDAKYAELEELRAAVRELDREVGAALRHLLHRLVQLDKRRKKAAA